MDYIYDKIISYAYRNNYKNFALLVSKVYLENDWNWGLYYACEHGYKDIAELMCEKGAFNLDDGLLEACTQGYKDIAELLLNKGASKVNRSFINACKHGHKDLVDLLISHGANDWYWGLFYACQCGCIDIALLIIKKWENNIRESDNGKAVWNTNLHNACFYGDKDITMLMIEKGADDWNGGFHRASLGGHEDLVLLMIEKGANDWNGGLSRACQGVHIELALLMIERGADIDKCHLYIPDHSIYYLVQMGVKDFGTRFTLYQEVSNTFKELCKILPNILDSILANDLILEILLY